MESRRRNLVAVPACRFDDLVGAGSKVVTLQGKSIGIFHRAGTVSALANRCPHKGAPVCLGRVRPRVSGEGPATVVHENEGSIIKCPWHQWEFEIESGRSTFDPKLRIVTYQTAVIDGVVQVYLPAQPFDQSKTTPRCSEADEDSSSC